MPAFQYQAINKNGKAQKGVIEADTERQARQLLREKNLTPIEIESVSEKNQKTPTKKRILSFKIQKNKMTAAELSLFTRQLATLLSAGIPLDEALTGVAEQTEKSHVKSIILGVRSKILEGHRLATGLSAFPKAFPNLYSTTVAAGEQSGQLDQVLESLADYTEKQNRIKQKIRQALLYPIIMCLVSLSVVVFMLIYVVPRIVSVFAQTKMTLPMATQILIALSHFIAHEGIYVLVGLLILFFIFRYLMKKPSVKSAVHVFWMKIPVLGKNFRLINCARFARTLGILTSASVPILEAMKAASQLITLLPMQEKVELAIDQVREGTPLSRALQQSGYFPPMFIHLIHSGESSGQLENMLKRAADNQDNDVELLIQNTLTLFEPMLILVMGGVVLFIVLAVLLPIFSLDQFNG